MEIKIHNLTKKYAKSRRKSLDDVGLSISKGIFGLIGENGAGKTTLLKSIATLLPINEGKISVLNYNLPGQEEEVRKILGYLPQDFDMFRNLTVFEMLDYIALLKNITGQTEREKMIIELLQKFNLEEKRNCKIKALSGGMKQRVGIIQAILGNPEIIILDEPTVGLDPNERLRFRNIINEISEEKIVILSSHIISDIAMMCENVAILREGKVIYCGSIDCLTQKVSGKVYVDTIDSTCIIDNPKYEKIISITRKMKKIEVRFLSEEVINDVKYRAVEPTLEDAYFYMLFTVKE